MRLRGIKTKQESNDFLKEYLPAYNRQFSIPAANDTNVHVELPKYFNANKALCIRTQRTVKNDHTIVMSTKLYQIEDSITAKKVTVEETMDGSLHMINNGVYKKRFGSRIVFPSDELFIKAKLSFPAASYYEDFAQIENGVGMVAQFLAEAGRTRIPAKIKQTAVSVVTGASFGPVLKNVLNKLREKGAKIRLITVPNVFLGPTVTVSGLLSGKDILRAVKGKRLGAALVIPDGCLKDDDDIFIDDMSRSDLEREIGIPVIPVSCFSDLAREGRAREGREGRAREAREGRAREGREGRAREAREGRAREGRAREGRAREGRAREGRAREGREGGAREARGGRAGEGREGEGREGEVAHAQRRTRLPLRIGVGTRTSLEASVSVDILTEITIDRPCDEVAAYAGDPDNAPTWYVNIESVEWKTPPPIRVGSRMAFVAQFLGRRLAYTYEIVDFVPDVRLVMRTAEGPFPMETTYRWEPVGERSTRMTLRNRGEPSGFSRFVAPLMAAAMRRANRKDLARLKSLLEDASALGEGK